jgi:sulfur relay (sulfurtransferase) DsrC/TusE family protein
MPTNTLNGRTFEVDPEGFFTNRDEWSEELAADLAALIGIAVDDEHIGPHPLHARGLRGHRRHPDAAPHAAVGGFDVKDLFALYPGKPAKKMAWLAGLPKPVGCV